MKWSTSRRMTRPAKQPPVAGPVTTTNRSEGSARLLALLLQWGFDRSAATMYTRILAQGPIRLGPGEAEGAVEKLLRLRLIGRTRRRGQILHHAMEPRTAWLALAAQVVWNKISTLAPVGDLPAVDDPESDNLRRLCVEIAEAATPAYREQAGVVVGDERPLDTLEELIQVVCEAVTRASPRERILAVHRSPFVIPTNSFWSALTSAMDRGATYHRVTDVDEIITHGLTIADRDINARGIDTRVIERDAVLHHFYLVGQRLLVVINSPEATDRGVTVKGVGALVAEPHVLKRYAEHHAGYAVKAIPGNEVISRLRSAAAGLIERARRELRPIEVAWLRDLIEYGRFSVFSMNEFSTSERSMVERRLVRAGLARRDSFDALVPNYSVRESDLHGDWPAN